MKKSMLFFSLFLSFQASSSERFSRILLDETHQSAVTLNTETVRCSAVGYGFPELKVTLESLKWATIFDHSNQDGLGPCITAGTMLCEDFTVPDVLIDSQNETENIAVRVTLTESFTISDQKCFRSLDEDVTTTIRGIPFTHRRSAFLGELNVDECKSLIK
ncbi:hypothetical protein [Bacteriovorax sp. Seq25_V]|uniref:hypothetical protein n=1 Tax=Bacteriovorax sp. Seq25_V TaxID=1201288 RepID=UPI000389F51C|nr:hypothetical protein [Bacteriovorax sp. Seq25_V]EQC43875.1 hypothetical protein M900_1204 [Bacteriovorax sp. Seq25_V]